MREKYWIVRDRQNVRKILKKCYVCKIVPGKTLKPVETPTLPIIHGRSISNHCDEEIQSKNVTAKDVRNVCKHTDIVFKHFIQRFKNEYLLALLEKHSYVK